MSKTLKKARANHPCLGSSNSLQCSLDLTLNRSLLQLHLKAVKVGPVVFDLGPETA